MRQAYDYWQDQPGSYPPCATPAGAGCRSIHGKAQPQHRAPGKAHRPPPRSPPAAGTHAAAMKNTAAKSHRRPATDRRRGRNAHPKREPRLGRAARERTRALARPRTRPTRPPHAPESAFTPSNPTHPRNSPNESTARPRKKAQAASLARRGRSWATPTIATSAHPPTCPGAQGGERGARPRHRPRHAPPTSVRPVRIHTSHTVNVRKPTGSLFLDARRPGAHTTTHAPGPPKTVPHRILGTGRRPRRRPQAPNASKRAHTVQRERNKGLPKHPPSTRPPTRRGTNRGTPADARPMLVPSSPYAT